MIKRSQRGFESPHINKLKSPSSSENAVYPSPQQKLSSQESAKEKIFTSPPNRNPVARYQADIWMRIPGSLRKILVAVFKAVDMKSTESLNTQALLDIYHQVTTHKGLASVDLTSVLLENLTTDKIVLMFLKEELGYCEKSNTFQRAGNKDGDQIGETKAVTLIEFLSKIMAVFAQIDDRKQNSGGSCASPMSKLLHQSLPGKGANFKGNESLISPLVSTTFIQGVKNSAILSQFAQLKAFPQSCIIPSPSKDRRISHSESGLSELQANEKICNQSPMPSQLLSQSSGFGQKGGMSGGYGGELSNLQCFNRLLNYQKAKQTTAAKDLQMTSQAMKALVQSPDKQIKDIHSQLAATPPAKGDHHGRILNLESTQPTSILMQSREKHDHHHHLEEGQCQEQVKGRNIIELFQMNSTSAKPDMLLNSYKHHSYLTESVLSQNTTPQKQTMFRMEPHSQHFYKTDQKQQPLKRNLFATTNNFGLHDSPIGHLPLSPSPYHHIDHFNNRELSPQRAQRLALFGHSPISQVPTPQFGPMMHHHTNLLSPTFTPQPGGGSLGSKRLRGDDDEFQSKGDTSSLPPQFQTPYQTKRKRRDPYSAQNKEERKETVRMPADMDSEGLSGDEDDEYDDEEDPDGGNSAVHRTKRGLKILSVKVRELVEKKGQTTYKDVANELIRQLREQNKANDGLFDIDDSDEDPCNEEMSEDSPDKRTTASASKKENENPVLQKWEKNVRRRVYDALNVLYAAGVLRKDNKNVTCDPEVLQMSKEIQEQLGGDSKISSLASSAEKPDRSSVSSAYEQQLREEIAVMQNMIEAKKVENHVKREALCENFKQFICYKHLIERNKNLESTGVFPPDKKHVKLPFILVTTKDTPENEIDLTYGSGYRQLNVSMKKHFNLIGDVDALMKFKFFRVEEDWLRHQIPSELEQLPEVLSQKQMNSIVIKKKKGVQE